MIVGRRIAVDESLRGRRRAIEMCAFIARGLGLLSTLAVTADLPGMSLAPIPGLRTACWTACVVMAVANALALAGFRRPTGPRYRILSGSQIALDVLVVTAVVVAVTAYTDRTVWPVLAVPIVAAAIRHDLRAALAVWAVTSASFVATFVAVGGPASRPEDVPFAIILHLLIALVTGTQSTAFLRQLGALHETRLALQHQAGHDPLTGLPNRARLEEHAARHGTEPMAVLLLDLDGFKPVNDSLGHAAGDEVLRQVAARLSAAVRPGDLAGRLGGDEFLVVLPGCDAATAADIGTRIGAAVRAPMRVQGHEVTIGASVGAAVRALGADEDLASLSGRADAAMYQAKFAKRAAA